MFAYIKTGGKQYKVSEGTVEDIEKLDLAVGEKVVFDVVLGIGEEGGEVKLGTPTITGATVEAEVLEQFRGKKVWAFHMHRRKSYRRTHGHRQDLTKIKITAIKNA